MNGFSPCFVKDSWYLRYFINVKMIFITVHQPRSSGLSQQWVFPQNSTSPCPQIPCSHLYPLVLPFIWTIVTLKSLPGPFLLQPEGPSVSKRSFWSLTKKCSHHSFKWKMIRKSDVVRYRAIFGGFFQPKDFSDVFLLESFKMRANRFAYAIKGDLWNKCLQFLFIFFLSPFASFLLSFPLSFQQL